MPDHSKPVKWLRPVPYQPPCFGGWKGGAGWAVKTRTSQGGNTTEITTDLDTSLTVRQHVRAAIRWWLPLDPACRAVGFFFAALYIVYAFLASLITWSPSPLIDTFWVAQVFLGILVVWKAFFTLAILGLWVCGGRKQSLKGAWDGVTRDLGSEPYFPLIQRELQLRKKRQDSVEYLVEQGYSREKAKRLAQFSGYH